MVENEGIGFEIFKNEVNDAGIRYYGDSIALCQGGYQIERQVSLEVELERGSYYLVPTTFYPKTHLNYYITIWHKMVNGNTRTIEVFEVKGKFNKS